MGGEGFGEGFEARFGGGWGWEGIEAEGLVEEDGFVDLVVGDLVGFELCEPGGVGLVWGAGAEEFFEGFFELMEGGLGWGLVDVGGVFWGF